MKARSQQCLCERPKSEGIRLTHYEVVDDELAALSAKESLQWLLSHQKALGPQKLPRVYKKALDVLGWFGCMSHRF